MAKKKKTVKRKSTKAEAIVHERSPFWDYSGAVVLMLLAVFLLLGGFGTGGPLPVGLFHAMYWLFGWAAYLTPVALVYLGGMKFIAEDRRIPLAKLSGMLGLLLFTGSLFYTVFASRNRAHAWGGGHGGTIGKGLGNVALSVLDKIPASLLFLVFALLALFFAFGIDPKIMMKLNWLA